MKLSSGHSHSMAFPSSLFSIKYIWHPKYYPANKQWFCSSTGKQVIKQTFALWGHRSAANQMNVSKCPPRRPAKHFSTSAKEGKRPGIEVAADHFRAPKSSISDWATKVLFCHLQNSMRPVWVGIQFPHPSSTPWSMVTVKLYWRY